jgi:hypothetical protein
VPVPACPARTAAGAIRAAVAAHRNAHTALRVRPNNEQLGRSVRRGRLTSSRVPTMLLTGGGSRTLG